MSIFRSYFLKNNTISRLYPTVNSSRNPATILKYGEDFTKYIFRIDLDPLRARIADGNIFSGSTLTHRLHMTNCIFGDEDFLGEVSDATTQRTSSFDLIVFKIDEEWDEGAGYEFTRDSIGNKNHKLFNESASNWYNATTLSGWTVSPGIYSVNLTGGTSGLTILAVQHFDRGSENLDIDLTNYISGVLSGDTDYGIGIAFAPMYELLADLTYDQSVSFFTMYTNTFYEPYLETSYNNIVSDDRNEFTLGLDQHLCIYINQGGNGVNLDNAPSVSLLDQNKIPIAGYSGLTAIQVSKGIYCVSVNLTGITECENKLYFFDKWENLSLAGNQLNAVTQKFIPKSLVEEISFANQTSNPQYVPFLYGIKRGEKIIRGDIRKIIIEAKEFVTGSKRIIDGISYRIYVTEGGKTQIDVVPWTPINKTSNENNFFLDTSFLIPKEYFIDVKIERGGEVSTIRELINFQIVSEK